MIFGAENITNPARNHKIIEDFSDQVTILPIFDCLLKCGKEKARLRKAGVMISDFDLLIGCTSIVSELIMVTENLKEFERIEGIQLENWSNRNK